MREGEFAFNLRFPGQYYDVETGLHYNYFRDYDPGIGRYVQSDPIGLAGGLNTYGYGDSTPVHKIDPWGLSAFPLPRPWPIPICGENVPGPCRPPPPNFQPSPRAKCWISCAVFVKGGAFALGTAAGYAATAAGGTIGHAIGYCMTNPFLALGSGFAGLNACQYRCDPMTDLPVPKNMESLQAY